MPSLVFAAILLAVYLLPLSANALLPVCLGLMAIIALCLGLLWHEESRKVRRLKHQFEQVETLLSAHPALTLTLGLQGQPLAAYGAAPLCLPIDDLFRDGLIDAVHAPDRPAVQAALQRAHAGTTTQLRFTPRRALDLRLSISLSPLETRVDEAPRLVAVIMDASLDHAREAELISARSEAEAQNLAKSRVLANVSHELRTPLNAVIGFSDIMVQRLFGSLPDRYADYAASIHDAGNHLLSLIGDLLDVSRIEADRYDLNLESLDVREVIASALTLMRISADEKGLNLIALQPPVPLRAVVDQRALKQIVLNLLSNAIKFTPSGGTVTLTASAQGSDLELIIADTGLGIAPEDIDRLGQPFEQAGEMGQRQQGTGLGLALVRALSERHGGQMSIDSTLGSGTAITVRLPVMEGEKPETLPQVQTQAQIIPLNRAKPYRQIAP